MKDLGLGHSQWVVQYPADVKAYQYVTSSISGKYLYGLHLLKAGFKQAQITTANNYPGKGQTYPIVIKQGCPQMHDPTHHRWGRTVISKGTMTPRNPG